jgi:hypothetical protein
MADGPQPHYTLYVPWWKRSQRPPFKGFHQLDNIRARKRATKHSSATRMAQRFAERMGK